MLFYANFLVVLRCGPCVCQPGALPLSVPSPSLTPYICSSSCLTESCLSAEFLKPFFLVCSPSSWSGLWSLFKIHIVYYIRNTEYILFGRRQDENNRVCSISPSLAKMLVMLLQPHLRWSPVLSDGSCRRLLSLKTEKSPVECTLKVEAHYFKKK